jgi:arylsulfatase A
LARETLFVFVSDNGWTPGTRRHKTDRDFFYHTRESKRSPFEDGLRTPILLRWDGVIRPATHESLCSSVDLVPTILSAAGLEHRMPGRPGVDLMVSARGIAPLQARPVFGEIYPGDATALGEPSRDLAYRWVREGDFKLIVPHPGPDGSIWGGYLKNIALHDVVRDPGETRNRANEAGQRARVERLTRLLDNWWTPGDDAGVPKPKANP